MVPSWQNRRYRGPAPLPVTDGVRNERILNIKQRKLTKVGCFSVERFWQQSSVCCTCWKGLFSTYWFSVYRVSWGWENHDLGWFPGPPSLFHPSFLLFIYYYYFEYWPLLVAKRVSVTDVPATAHHGLLREMAGYGIVWHLIIQAWKVTQRVKCVFNLVVSVRDRRLAWHMWYHFVFFLTSFLENGNLSFPNTL